MYYPFSEKTDEKIKDEDLIKSALSGNKKSLEELIKRHQNWIYNLSLRMVFYPDDAKDITQEVLIKIITKIGHLRRKKQFQNLALQNCCKSHTGFEADSRRKKSLF